MKLYMKYQQSINYKDGKCKYQTITLVSNHKKIQ